MDPSLKLEELYLIDNLELIAKQVVEGFIIGLHKSPFHGFSVEFAEHRLYNPGDPIKDIDWKVFGRTDKFFVKKFEEETNLRCQLVVDVSSSMYFPEITTTRPINKIKFSVIAAAALMKLFKRQRDAVGLTLFADQLEYQSGAKSSTVHHKLQMSQLSDALTNNPKNKKTAAAQSLHHVAESIHKRSLVIIFSDMMDDMDHMEETFSALQHLKYNKHEVILFHVIDKALELDFEFENRSYTFIDVETGEKIKLQPNQVKSYYVDQMQRFKKELRLKCAQYKIDFIEADINKDYEQILVPYLVKRSKMK